ncbi:hypothetical protein RYX36_021582, partial [Vicia faba]
LRNEHSISGAMSYKSLVAQNGSAILPIIFDALEYNMKSHENYSFGCLLFFAQWVSSKFGHLRIMFNNNTFARWFFGFLEVKVLLKMKAIHVLTSKQKL